jgi:hypothetical protein
MQLQVLAMLGSLSGIAYPTRVASLISVARLANLDLVRFAALPQGPPTSISTVKVWFPGQALLQAECNPHSRTDYFTTNAVLFALPGFIVLYIAGIKLCLWLLRPAVLSVRPQLAESAFFSHKAHDKTNALCKDVRTPFLVLLSADCPIVCYSPHSSKVLSAGRDWAG